MGERGGFLDDDNGATPVVGIVLLVAITLLLSAVVANAVFGLGLFDRETGPSIVFDDEYDEDAEELDVTHESGSTVEMEHVVAVASGGNGTVDVDFSRSTVSSSDTLMSGETLVLTDVQEGETIRLIWESPDSEKSYVVFKTTV